MTGLGFGRKYAHGRKPALGFRQPDCVRSEPWALDARLHTADSPVTAPG